MKNIQVNKDGNVAIAKVVRYIKLDGLKYIIYSLNEIDEEEYEKLYVNKVEDNSIIEIEEWVNFKKAVPMIVKSIKADTIEGFEDLSINDINEIDTTNYKAFKLKKDIVFSIIKEEDPVEEVVEEKIEEPVEETEIEEPTKEETIPEANEESIEEFEFHVVNPVADLEAEENKESIPEVVEESDDDDDEYENEYNITTDFKSEILIEKERSNNNRLEQLEQELKEKDQRIKELEDRLNQIKDMLK